MAVPTSTMRRRPCASVARSLPVGRSTMGTSRARPSSSIASTTSSGIGEIDSMNAISDASGTYPSVIMSISFRRAGRRRRTARRPGWCRRRSRRRRCTGARWRIPSTACARSGWLPRRARAGRRRPTSRRIHTKNAHRPTSGSKGRRPRPAPVDSQTTKRTSWTPTTSRSRRDTSRSGPVGSLGVTRYQCPRIIAAKTPPVASVSAVSSTRSGPAAGNPPAQPYGPERDGAEAGGEAEDGDEPRPADDGGRRPRTRRHRRRTR